MALLKKWSIPPLAALLLLLSIVPTGSKVVDSMSQCAEFLLNGTPPNVPGILEGGNILDQNRYKPICQTFIDIRRFVTLYDTKNKIPVFSASKYNGTKGKRPAAIWKIEPQLENIGNHDNMAISMENNYRKQASNNNYANQGFDRGHLFPSSYAPTVDHKMSTFTLTNIVPQYGPFNQGRWSKMESCIKCVMNKYCINGDKITEGFLVIGAQPGNNIISNNINVPSMLWSAFCCYSHSEKGWISSAHWGPNVPDGEEYLQTRTLEELERELSTVSTGFKVFPGSQCPLNKPVTQFYPKLNAGNPHCKCPLNTEEKRNAPQPPFKEKTALICVSVAAVLLIAGAFLCGQKMPRICGSNVSGCAAAGGAPTGLEMAPYTDTPVPVVVNGHA